MHPKTKKRRYNTWSRRGKNRKAVYICIGQTITTTMKLHPKYEMKGRASKHYLHARIGCCPSAAFLLLSQTIAPAFLTKCSMHRFTGVTGQMPRLPLSRDKYTQSSIKNKPYALRSMFFLDEYMCGEIYGTDGRDGLVRWISRLHDASPCRMQRTEEEKVRLRHQCRNSVIRRGKWKPAGLRQALCQDACIPRTRSFP